MFSGAIQGLRELKSLALVRLIRQVTLLLLVCFLMRALSWGLKAALSIHVFSIFLALCLSILLTRIFLHKHSTREEKENRFEDSRWVHNAQAIIRFATPISAAAVASSWIQSSGPAIISYLSNNNPGKQLGILAVLLTLSRALDTIIKTIVRSAFPYLVKWNIEGNQLKIRRYVNLVTLFVVAGYALLIAGSLLVGNRIIPLLFGRDYLAAAGYLPVTLLAFCSISLQDIYRISLFSLKVPGLLLFVQFAGAFIFILSVVLGNYLLNVNDLVHLVFLSMGLANFIVFLGALFFFNAQMRRCADRHLPVLES